ncbi:hypothetical protein BASA81_003375 [Batrachochytrium salamandrivorans]|nr:hypothetical protein BASA81_003375 [Batrachochytrium salamandrivorans]
MATLKLVTYPALFRSQKVIIVSELAKVALDIDTNTTQAQLDSLSVHGKVPCLVTPEGNISESNAIARYIARLADPKIGLLGSTPFESAQVDSWVDFCVQDLEIPATLWVAPLLGWMPEDSQVTKRAQEDLKKGLAVLDNHLKQETFVVGNKITIADVAIFSTLLLPFKLVIQEVGAKKQFPNVMRWFDLLAHQQAFIDVVGETKLCEVPLVAAPGAKKEVAPKKEAAPKAEAKPKAEPKAAAAPKRKQEDAEEDAPVEKKAANPLDSLPKSTMVLDAWKREYSNCPNQDTTLAMPWFWENVDLEGYSLWFCDYNFNDECKVSFMTSNLVAGFVQRTDALRKYAFGVMQIIGDNTQQKVLGAWLFRGQDTKFMLQENDDAEYYTWTKFTGTDEEKQRIQVLWCAEDAINGEKILDCKVFK